MSPIRLAALLLVTPCLGHAAAPAEVVSGFEVEGPPASWRPDPGVRAAVTSERATEGEGALVVTCPPHGGGITLDGLARTDWSSFGALQADLYNPGDSDLEVIFRVSDVYGRVAERTQVVRADCPGLLWMPLSESRGLDLRTVTRVWIGLPPGQHRARWIVDNLRLIPETKPIPIMASGETVVEAEDFSRGHATVDREGWAQGSSPLVTDLWPGPIWVEYDLAVFRTGRYRLEARYASAELRPVYLFMDGVLVDDLGLSGSTGSFAGTRALWRPVAVLPLSAGRHLMRITPWGCLPHLDAFRFIPTTAPVAAPALSDRASRLDRELASSLELLWALSSAEKKALQTLVATHRAALRDLRGPKDLLWAERKLLALRRRWDLLRQRLIPHWTGAAYGMQGRSLDYGVGVESTARKVSPCPGKFEGEVGASVEVALARGESEGAQLVLFTGSKALRAVRVWVSDLAGPAGATLPASAVQVHPVGYVEASNHPQRGIRQGDWVADPLVVNKPFGVAAHRAQPVWLTVHAPEDARPGRYEGTVTVAPAGAPQVRVPLRVRVWDFELPPEDHLKTSFVLWWSREAVSRPEFEQWVDFVLSYRIGIMDIGWGPIRRTETGYDYSRVDEDLQYCLDRGMNSFSMADFAAGPYEPEREAELRRFLADYAQHLRDRGWFDKAYLKLHDEPSPEIFPRVRAQAELVREIDPTIRRLCTVAINQDLVGAVDIWCPITSWADPVAVAAARARGEDVWVYTCGGPGPPTPNIAHLRQDAMGHRLLAWHCWGLGASGYLYWSLKFWPDANTTNGDHQWSAWRWAQGAKVRLAPQPEAGPGWPLLAWVAGIPGLAVGDGYLIYPGPEGQPLPSIRLECFRDGVEDTEYLALLEERAEAARAAGQRAKAQRAERLLAQARDLASLRDRWSPDPGRLLDLRRRIGEELEKG